MTSARMVIVVATSLGIAEPTWAQSVATKQPSVVARSAKIIELRGLRFHDLNKNGVLDPYEDWRLFPRARAKNHLGPMELAGKARELVDGPSRHGGPLGISGGGGHSSLANTPPNNYRG